MSVHVFGYGREAMVSTPPKVQVQPVIATAPSRALPAETASNAAGPSDRYGVGSVTDDEIERFRRWLVTSKSPPVSARVAGNYVSRLRRALRSDDVSSLTIGVAE